MPLPALERTVTNVKNALKSSKEKIVPSDFLNTSLVFVMK